MIHLRRGVESWLRGSSKGIPRSVKIFSEVSPDEECEKPTIARPPKKTKGITGHLDIGYRWTVRPEASTWWRWEMGRYILLYDDCWKKVQRSVEYLWSLFWVQERFCLLDLKRCGHQQKTPSDHDYHNFFTDVSRWLVFVGRRSKTKQLWLVRS